MEAWAGALLSKLSPMQRRAVNRKIGMELRRRQAQRITSQKQPDGNDFAPRKQGKDLKGKKGRIKQKKAQMFTKLRTARFLKVATTESQIAVGFFDRVARIARVHQYGLTDKVGKNGPSYKYPARVLLGFSEGERDLIRDALLNHIQ